MPKGRVRIREVPYKVIVEDALGGQSIQYDTAYGPGWPANLPTERLAREPAGVGSWRAQAPAGYVHT